MDAPMFLVVGDERHPLTLPHPGADVVCVGGMEDCPSCGSLLLTVRGKGMRISEDDRAYESDGHATCCGAYLGKLRVEPSTIFGLREDEAVLYGRARVY